MTTIFIDDKPQYWADGPPGVFVPLAEADALQAQIAALATERDALSGALRNLREAHQELSRLAIDVADYIRDTSWSMGPIRKLVEYIDNKDKENKDNERSD